MNDGSVRHLKLSVYGGFFKILGQCGIFYFQGEARKKWEEKISLVEPDNYPPGKIERDD